MKTTNFPPLPIPKQLYRDPSTGSVVYGHTEEQMESYADLGFVAVEEWKTDAARYRWLADRMVHVGHPAGSGWTLDEVLVSNDQTLDEVIDALRSALEGKR